MLIGLEYSKNVKVIKWKDKRDVLMISIRKDHDSTLLQTNKKGRNGQIIEKPSCILDYNNAKKGVNLLDQLSTYYNALRKGRK